MGLLADGTVGHGAGFEAFHDRFSRFNLVKRHRWHVAFELQQAAQGVVALALLVNQRRKYFEFLVIVGADRFLERSDRQRIILMLLTILAPLVNTARGKGWVGCDPLRISAAMALHQFASDAIDVGAADA